MADVVYDLAVALELRFAGFASSVSTVQGLLRSLEKQANASSVAGAKLGLVMGGAITAGGVAGGLAMKSWIDAAARMDLSLQQVGLTATGTSAQLQALYAQSFKVASQTMFSAPQILDMEQRMARMGFRDLSGQQTQRQVIGAAIPEFARAAEVNQSFTKEAPSATIDALSMQSHMYGQYSGAGLAKMVAYSIGASLNSGMTEATQANVMRYLAPAVKTGQLTTLDSFALAALANQTGLSRRGGGASTAMLLRSMAPTGSAKHDDALAVIERLGGGDFYRNGSAVPFPTALGILNRFYDSHGITNEQRGVVARNAFAASGSTAAAVLGNDTSVGQFGAIRTSIAQWTPQKLTDTQTKLNETLIHQVATLRTNMGSLAAILGKPLLLDATGAVHNLVLLTDKLIAFTTTHPAFTAMVAKFVEVGSIAALIAGPVIMLAGTLGALSVAGGLVATGFGIMGTAAGFLALGLAPLLIEFIPFIALAAGAVYIFEHWTNISRLLGQMLGWVGDKLHAFMVELGLAQDKTIPSANAYDPVTTHGHYIARKGAMQWIPDPGSTPIKPATGGGVSGVPATTVVHIHNHIHGVDHKTAKDLANTVTKHVSDNLADLHDKARTFGSSTPYPTRPGRLG